MSRTKLSLRSAGRLPADTELTTHLPMPFQLMRSGTLDITGRKRTRDVAVVPLAQWNTDTDVGADQQTRRIVQELQYLVPFVAALDQTQITAELYVSTVRHHDQGGFTLPAEILHAVSQAHVALSISITVALDDEDEPNALNGL